MREFDQPPIGNLRPVDITVAESGPEIKSEGVTMPAYNWRFLNINELFDLPEQDDWLLTDLLARGEVAMLFGEPGAGKSFLALDLAYALAAGVSWGGGKFSVPSARRVLYATSEGRRGVRRRLQALNARYREHEMDIPPDRLLTALESPQLFDATAARNIFGFVTQYKETGLPPLDLVIIDTLHRSSEGADENNVKDAGVILRSIDHIREQLGAAVCLVHHCNKMNGRERGSSAFRGAMDAVIEARRISNTDFRLCYSKLKDAEPFSDLSYTLSPYLDSAIVHWRGEAIDEASGYAASILAELDEENWLTAKELGVRTGIIQANVTRAIQTTLCGKIETCLTDPSKSKSNRNPIRYRRFAPKDYVKDSE